MFHIKKDAEHLHDFLSGNYQHFKVLIHGKGVCVWGTVVKYLSGCCTFRKLMLADIVDIFVSRVF